MRTAYRPRANRSLISLTPLIDVVFILLVFFMLASSFVEWQAIDLGESGPPVSVSSGDAAMVVRVQADGTVLIKGDRVAPEALAARLQALAATAPEQRLAVEPMPGVSLQQVVDVLEAAAGAGLSAVSLVDPAGD